MDVRTDIASLGANRASLGRLDGATRNDPLRSTGESGKSAVDFGRQLLEQVASADSLIQKAEQQSTALARDEGDAVETIIAVSKADLALRQVTTLRNRALEAYQEIMRMPL